MNGRKMREEKILLGFLLAGAIFMLLASCGNHVPATSVQDGGPITDIFYRCEEGVACETGQCSALGFDDAGPTVCTVPCTTKSDCEQEHINSFCMCTPNEEHICWRNVPGHEDSPAHCSMPCWPAEEREVCDRYEIFCPSDCAEQGLRCQITTVLPLYYTCR